MLLWVKADPPAWVISISFHPLLGFLGIPEGRQLGWGVGDGEDALGAVIHLAGSTNSGISSHSEREPGTCGSLIPSPGRMASSSKVGEVPHSTSVGFRREASTISFLLRIIRGAIHLQALMWHHVECLLGPQILWHRPVVPGPRPGSSLAS